MPQCLRFNIMGCLPSRRRNSPDVIDDIAPQANAASSNTDEPKCVDPQGLTPTIQMVNEDTLKLLREIGELKVFTTADASDRNRNLSIHHDIMLALENPTGKTATAMPANVKWSKRHNRSHKSAAGRAVRCLNVLLRLARLFQWDGGCSVMRSERPRITRVPRD